MARTSANRKKLEKLIEGIDIAMFTTLGDDGFLVSRPLSTQDAQFDGEALWFFVRRQSPKVREIARNPKVNVAYASKDRNAYVSVAGTAELVDEQERIDAYWSDALKAYFPKGRTDPQLTLIRVNVRTVQYWEGPSTGLGKLIAFVVARITKNDSALGENRMIRLRRTPAVRNAASRKTATRKASARKSAGGRSRGTKARASGKSKR